MKVFGRLRLLFMYYAERTDFINGFLEESTGNTFPIPSPHTHTPKTNTHTNTHIYLTNRYSCTQTVKSVRQWVD